MRKICRAKDGMPDIGKAQAAPAIEVRMHRLTNAVAVAFCRLARQRAFIEGAQAMGLNAGAVIDPTGVCFLVK